MVADWQTAAEHFADIGPPVAYVGFSMGAIFGIPTVAAIGSIGAAVFVAGGIPGSGWTDDASLSDTLLGAAGELGHAHVLMLNMTEDVLFSASNVRRLFGAVHARSKLLNFWDGNHDDWRPDLIAEAIGFVNAYAAP
jgi:hypothetical protein